jgi:hypothetical protein
MIISSWGKSKKVVVKKIHNEGFHDSHSTPQTIWEIKPKMIKSAANVASAG